ncbi:MarR family winged helix-turn-helix transcriptional regulator [Cohnella sp. REN36]|uniref:MarR family winged helix-turn-helix transcriptional regulator n=1 Tax=Cohnella sp. REN36 TaxID=2887347 RepID=UPI001D156427|nr:MarR family transcriptional regulator [Cohnella sp. REN36]MCC3373551.1 MarR family transcriptional regulator [Cohnella sp. REN36]
MSSEFEQVQSASNQLGQQFSLALIMFHQSLADKVGLNLTDYKVLGIIGEGVTAGKIAEITGLSSGMVTTVVDRLEKKDYVFRDKDAQDRRKVIIKLNSDKVASELAPLFQSFGQVMGTLFSKYNAQEFAILEDFMRNSIDIFQKETIKIRE